MWDFGQSDSVINIFTLVLSTLEKFQLSTVHKYKENLQGCLAEEDPLPEGTYGGIRVLIYREVLNGLTAYKRLFPPPQAHKSRVSFWHWKARVGHSYLVKLRLQVLMCT